MNLGDICANYVRQKRNLRRRQKCPKKMTTLVSCRNYARTHQKQTNENKKTFSDLYTTWDLDVTHSVQIMSKLKEMTAMLEEQKIITQT